MDDVTDNSLQLHDYNPCKWAFQSCVTLRFPAACSDMVSPPLTRITELSLLSVLRQQIQLRHLRSFDVHLLNTICIFTMKFSFTGLNV